MTSDTARANQAMQEARAAGGVEGISLNKPVTFGYYISIYHGPADQTSFAFVGADAAEAFVARCAEAMADTVVHGTWKFTDEVGTELIIRGRDILTVRLMTSEGQRRIIVAGNLENVRQQQATQLAMKNEMGMVPDNRGGYMPGRRN